MFHHLGNQYFLAEVWGDAGDQGMTIPASKLEQELQIAQGSTNQRKYRDCPQTTESAANQMRSRNPVPASSVCRACSTARRCKSSTQPDGGEGLAKRKGEITLVVRRGLKEAWSKDASR